MEKAVFTFSKKRSTNRKLLIIYFIFVVISCLSISLLASIYHIPLFVSVTTVGLRDNERTENLCGLNAHLWDGICLTNAKEICKFPIFPKAPTLRVIANSSKVIYPFTDIAVRLFGFIHPPVTGRYNFSVNISSHSSFTLLLSTDEEPSNSRRLSRNSDQVRLEKGKKYFMDLLYTQGKNAAPNVALTWQKPGENTFGVIEDKSLSVYLNDSELRTRKMHDPLIPGSSVCDFAAKPRTSDVNSYFKWEQTTYVNHKEVEDTLPFCEYSPSYVLGGRKVKNVWEAVHKLVYHTFIYPFPKNKSLIDPKMWIFPLNQSIARDVVESYLNKLEGKHPGEYKFLSIKSVEQKEDQHLGFRYLLELNLQRNRDGKVVVLSEYAFQQKNDSSLCYPVGIQWNRTADIYIVVTSKNQGRWVQHFINNMARIYRETNDQHFHLVIFDFESEDIDVGDALKKSLLPRYTVIRKPGEFIKTKAYNEAVRSVKDPNAIIFLIDLHLEIASHFLDSIRKHCFRGKMIYTPIIVRMDCGSFLDRPRGEWEVYGYGLLGAFKSDWDRFGGYTKHRKGWGGEDWDIMDNVVEAGLEFERMRTPYVYHYYHHKKGMWN